MHIEMKLTSEYWGISVDDGKNKFAYMVNKHLEAGVALNHALRMRREYYEDTGEESPK